MQYIQYILLKVHIRHNPYIHKQIKKIKIKTKNLIYLVFNSGNLIHLVLMVKIYCIMIFIKNRLRIKAFN